MHTPQAQTQGPDPNSAAPAVAVPTLRAITCHIDFISPYAWLAFARLPQALEGISYSIDYRPVFLGGLLQHHGQLGPAEIMPKRDWTYRQVLWLAHTLDVDLHMPSSHPFNPLPLLRLALACTAPGQAGTPNRWVCETVFRHVWQGGQDAVAPERLQALAEQLSPARDWQGVDSNAIKAELKHNTDAAVAAGVFGVPSFGVDDKVFWGLDALPMLRAYLLDDPWFAGPAWNSADRVSFGIRRRGPDQNPPERP